MQSAKYFLLMCCFWLVKDTNYSFEKQMFLIGFFLIVMGYFVYMDFFSKKRIKTIPKQSLIILGIAIAATIILGAVQFFIIL